MRGFVPVAGGAVDVNAAFTLSSGYLVFFMHCGAPHLSQAPFVPCTPIRSLEIEKNNAHTQLVVAVNVVEITLQQYCGAARSAA